MGERARSAEVAAGDRRHHPTIALGQTRRQPHRGKAVFVRPVGLAGGIVGQTCQHLVLLESGCRDGLACTAAQSKADAWLGLVEGAWLVANRNAREFAPGEPMKARADQDRGRPLARDSPIRVGSTAAGAGMPRAVQQITGFERHQGLGSDLAVDGQNQGRPLGICRTRRASLVQRHHRGGVTAAAQPHFGDAIRPLRQHRFDQFVKSRGRCRSGSIGQHHPEHPGPPIERGDARRPELAEQIGERRFRQRRPSCRVEAEAGVIETAHGDALATSVDEERVPSQQREAGLDRDIGQAEPGAGREHAAGSQHGDTHGRLWSPTGRHAGSNGRRFSVTIVRSS